jgi:hypothetical protein
MSRVRVSKDGNIWQIRTMREVAWIAGGTTPGTLITIAIPLVEAYACGRL